MKAKGKNQSRPSSAVSPLVSTTTKMPETLRARLLNWAVHEDRSASWVLVDALTEYLDQREQRQAFIDEAKAAWEHYERTGIHYTPANMRQFAEQLKNSAGKAKA